MVYEGIRVGTKHDIKNMNMAEQSGIDCRKILEVRCWHLSSNEMHEKAR
jgi:hypothetical protein